MKETEDHHKRIAQITFSSVYPHYISKVQRKGRTIEELHIVIEWLTGFDSQKLHEFIETKVTLREFFDHAKLHPNAHKIKGMICGYRIETLQNPLTQKVRYMDKLVDELAQGKDLNKILRT